MTVDATLAMPLAKALQQLCTVGVPVRVECVTPPGDARPRQWRVARVVKETDGRIVVTAVAEIEGTIGCNERLERDFSDKPTMPR